MPIWLTTWLAKPALPWIAAGVLLIALVVGFFLLRASWRAEGAQSVETAVAKAVLDQKAEDANVSAQLVQQLQTQITTLQANADQVREEVRYVPVTSGCGPSVNRAADWVRDALGPGGSPARP